MVNFRHNWTLREAVCAIWSLFGLVLFAESYRLWLPLENFPQVPLVYAMGGLSPVGDWTCVVLIAVGLVTAPLLALRYSRISLAAFLLGLALAMLIDQHRVQAWAYHGLLIAIALFIPTERRFRGFLLALTISIYVSSAVSKLDHAFLNGLGQQFLQLLAEILGLRYAWWSDSTKFALSALFPIGELLIGLLLLWPRWRSWGLVMAMIMHAINLALLGPWGLNHQWAVLLWNVAFIGLLAAMTFVRETESDASGATSDAATSRTSILNRAAKSIRGLCPRGWAESIVAAAILVPLAAPLGWVDHWPAWHLYSPGNRRALVYVRHPALASLPPPVQRAAANDMMLDGWRRIAIDRWSLASLNVPIYPENRFQLGVAIWLAEHCESDADVKIELQSSADRWTGERDVQVAVGLAEMQILARQFLFNARPYR